MAAFRNRSDFSSMFYINWRGSVNEACDYLGKLKSRLPTDERITFYVKWRNVKISYTHTAEGYTRAMHHWMNLPRTFLINEGEVTIVLLCPSIFTSFGKRIDFSVFHEFETRNEFLSPVGLIKEDFGTAERSDLEHPEPSTQEENGSVWHLMVENEQRFLIAFMHHVKEIEEGRQWPFPSDSEESSVLYGNGVLKELKHEREDGGLVLILFELNRIRPVSYFLSHGDSAMFRVELKLAEHTLPLTVCITYPTCETKIILPPLPNDTTVSDMDVDVLTTTTTTAQAEGKEEKESPCMSMEASNWLWYREGQENEQQSGFKTLLENLTGYKTPLNI